MDTKYTILDIHKNTKLLEQILTDSQVFEIYSADKLEKLYVYKDTDCVRTVFSYDDGDKRELDFEYSSPDMGYNLVHELYKYCVTMLRR